MNLFIAGICGTFMAGIAQLARELDFNVSGCDENIYPPMSTLLQDLDIELLDGYLPEHLNHKFHQIVIGNALSRGNPLVEAVFDQRLEYCSGPQWLYQNILRDRHVVAVAGTHGKTTTSSMLNWILYFNDLQPGYLIGGKPGNLAQSASLGKGKDFVIEADEYDTAFFDKRSKFIHYAPNVAVLNNLEFDHADIFRDLQQIQQHFHHFVRMVPGNGRIIVNADDANLKTVLEMGCWTPTSEFSIEDAQCEWYARPTTPDFSRFEISFKEESAATLEWNLFGRHNMQNALGAIAAAYYCGVSPEQSVAALAEFVHSNRRMQCLWHEKNTWVYEDFAHHPSAIKTTLEALTLKHPKSRILAVLEPRSNTMRSGVHGDEINRALAQADQVLVFTSDVSGKQVVTGFENLECFSDAELLLERMRLSLTGNDVIILMSNGGFENIPRRFVEILESTTI